MVRGAGISLDSTPDSLARDQTIHVTADCTYNGQEPSEEKADQLIQELGLTYTSSDPIDGTDITKECKITVLPSAEEVTLSDTSLQLGVGETKEVSFTFVPENAVTDYKFWYSGDESIATVEQDGKITGRKPGTCTISLGISDLNVSCKVTVK